MKRYLYILTAVIIFISGVVYADLKEGDLARYRGAFVSRILTDNPGREGEIMPLLESVVKEGAAGSRLIDRFGLFLYDSSRNRLALENIRFLKDSGGAVFFIVMKDSSDGKLYSLYLEYSVSGRGVIKLKNSYFSMIYNERIQSVTRFFGGE